MKETQVKTFKKLKYKSYLMEQKHGISKALVEIKIHKLIKIEDTQQTIKSNKAEKENK